jgi:hypothetical protein
MERMNPSQADFSPQVEWFSPFPLANEREREFGARAWKVGAEVKRLLSCPPLSGEVVAHLSGNLYLMTDHDDLFWGSTGSFPMHRRCLQVSYLPPLPHIRPGQRFQLKHSTLCIGNSFSIDLRSYTEWNPAFVFTKKPRPLAELWPRCWKLKGLFSCLDSPKGLGRAIPLIFAIAGNEEDSSLSSAPIAGQLLTPILAIAKACLRRDLNTVLIEGENLVGLGPGLTPSGDDFLGGLLFLIKSLDSAYPGFFPWNQEGVFDFIGRAKSQTHPISHTFLNDFAWGHAPAPWHELVDALIYRGDFEEIISAMLRCLGFGHSSGWDVLAGFLTGCLMVPSNWVDD